MTSLLASLEAFSAHRGVDLDATDLRATMALETASDVVRRYTGQLFDLVEDDEVRLDGTGSNALVLPQLPVVEVTEVTTFDRNGDNETLLLSTDYVLGTAGLLYRRAAYDYWPKGRANILVTYTHGWDPEVGIPADLRMVVLDIASRTFSGGTSGQQVQEQEIGTYRIRYATEQGSVGLLGSEVDVLNLWRLARVA